MFLGAEIDEMKLVAFLDRLYTLPVPDAGTCLYVPTITNSKPFICPIPGDLSLPSIPENVRNAITCCRERKQTRFN